MASRLKQSVAVIAIVCVSAAAGCAKARPTTSPKGTAGAAANANSDATSAVARLQQELATAFDDPSVNGLWAVEVQSFDTGEVLFQRNAHLLVMPASNMKIVTMAVAADRLGWEFRFTTELRTAATVNAGILGGDLIVVGGGDPTISDRAGDRFRVFEGWADQLRAAGVTRIDGRIIGDDNAFDDAPLGEGWMWDDLTGSSAPPGGALQFNENLVRVAIAPGAAAGQPAIVRLDPEGSGLTLKASVMTIAAPSPSSSDKTAADQASPARQLSLSRGLGSTTLEVEGVIPAGAKEIVRTTAVVNPTVYFVNALRATLIRKGIQVSGPAIDVDDVPMESAALSRATTVLVTHRSAPLSDVGTTFMKVSQNLFGETLMTTIGASSGRASKFVEPWRTAIPVAAGAAGAAGAPTGSALHHHIEAAREVYEEVLEGWGVPASQHVIADGSGLSRYNYLTAHMLVRILRQMALDPRHAAPFEATLPIAGKDGTLNRRMKGTKAENNVHAKTGTISNVRSLSGYVRTQDGERIGFSIIANNFKARSATVDGIAELAVERLANFTRTASKEATPRSGR